MAPSCSSSRSACNAFGALFPAAVACAFACAPALEKAAERCEISHSSLAISCFAATLAASRSRQRLYARSAPSASPPVLGQIVQRRHRRANSRVVGDVQIPIQRHIQVASHEHHLIREVIRGEVAHGFLGVASNDAARGDLGA